MNYTMQAPCLFGLESVLSGEVKRLGGQQVEVGDGRVTFQGDAGLLVRANLWLRTAERVGIVLGSFEARSFTQLFDQTAQLPFEQFIGRHDAFPVKGWSLKSGLHSIPDCQSIIKKAAVRRLETHYGQTWFEETGPPRQIRFTIHKDLVTIMLDSSGEGLHKRGYRRKSNEAPIKETLAAGIVDLAQARRKPLVIDPMCGSGTLVIEAAMRARNIPPGLNRSFAAERWDVFPESIWSEARNEARAAIDEDAPFAALAADLDPDAVALTAENAGLAGVGRWVTATCQDLSAFRPPEGDAVILCNPPYGERMLEIRQAEEIYRTMGRVFTERRGVGYYIISPHEQFEKLFGRPAKKRRKLYNGMMKCNLFMYY